MNSFGQKFNIAVSGGSHSEWIEVTISGCPAGISVPMKLLRDTLERRKPMAPGTTSRKECDVPEIIQGIVDEQTDGACIKIRFRNQDVRPSDYARFRDLPRPSHADFVAWKKYGCRADLSGGGMFSGRMTVALVAAGVVAQQLIQPATISATLLEVGGSSDIAATVASAASRGDSVGGIVECRVKNLPLGFGEPFFDGLESMISHLIFVIPGIRGIEFGTGFAAARMFGSQHNDCFIDAQGTTHTNHAGGINGGISNGNEIRFRVAVKPTPSIAQPQQTYNFATHQMDTLAIEGRHDVCFALRVPVVVEAVTAVALAECQLRNGCVD